AAAPAPHRPRVILRRVLVAACTALAVAGGRAPARAQSPAATVPWRVGEALGYDLKFGAIKVGSGKMLVVGTDTVRDRLAWRTRFTVSGGTFFYRVHDVLESWFDTQTLSSLRFSQDFSEGGRDREKLYEIFPDRRVFVEKGRPESPTVAEPLDDGSFLYFLRTVPLEVGKTYEFHRYFKPDRNPVVLRVLRRERIRVPAGEFACIVVQPIIKTTGIFSENGRAEVWLSDDPRRIMVQMKSKLPFGSLNLYLRSIAGPRDSTRPPSVP
ncbi:MAG: DUF3108 domain-containing protein, partial [Gemmatimonadaceae bacterium]|nr:DUF3108 domain-containing protein [Gemmatimonadaceae bacterium]